MCYFLCILFWSIVWFSVIPQKWQTTIWGILIDCFWLYWHVFYRTMMLPLITICLSLLCDHHNHFTALFPGQPGWASARRELLDFMVQGKINRGRHTDHPAGCHSIRTKQCPPPSSTVTSLAYQLQHRDIHQKECTSGFWITGFNGQMVEVGTG